MTRLDTSDPRTDVDDLRGDLVADGKGPREDAERRHRDVEIAAGDRQRPNDRLPGPGYRVWEVLPFQLAGFGEDQLLHRVPP